MYGKLEKLTERLLAKLHPFRRAFPTFSYGRSRPGLFPPSFRPQEVSSWCYNLFRCHLGQTQEKTSSETLLMQKELYEKPRLFIPYCIEILRVILVGFRSRVSRTATLAAGLVFLINLCRTNAYVRILSAYRDL